MSSANTTGLVTIALGCAIPVVVYLGAQVAMANEAAKGGPPNQGAMVIAFLALLASIGLGILVIAIGAFVLARSYWQLRKQPAGPPHS